jgi:hypothetical protein
VHVKGHVTHKRRCRRDFRSVGIVDSLGNGRLDRLRLEVGVLTQVDVIKNRVGEQMEIVGEVVLARRILGTDHVHGAHRLGAAVEVVAHGELM